MSSETKALTRPEKDREVVRQTRTGYIRERLERIAIDDLRKVNLARHALSTDEELDKAKLSAKERRIVRAWELPRKEVPFALSAAATRIEALLRREEGQKSVTVNVERAYIGIPSKAPDEDFGEGVIIDVEPVAK